MTTSWNRNTPGAAASASLLSQITAQAAAAAASQTAAAGSATTASAAATAAAGSKTNAESAATAAAQALSNATAQAIAAAASAAAAAATVAAFPTQPVTFSQDVTMGANLTVGTIKSPGNTGIRLEAQAGQIVQFVSNGIQRAYFNVAGHLVPNQDNTTDISDPATGYYFRHIYAGTTIRAGLRTGAGSVVLAPGTNDHCYIEFYARTATPQTRSGYLGFPSAGSTVIEITNQLTGGIAFLVNGALRWSVGSTASNYALLPGSDQAYDVGSATYQAKRVYVGPLGVLVNGVKVLGAQGASVADATDAASAITQLNALLARCRAHGLIA